MTKAFFYETEGGNIHRCMFAGLDKKGEAQWIMLDQGERVLMLSECYNQQGNGGVNLLCLEGEEVESTAMAKLLGAVIKSYLYDIPRQLSRCLELLEKREVTWMHDPLKLEVGLEDFSYATWNEYGFFIRCEGVGLVTEVKDFATMDELMDYMRMYFDALEIGARIFVESKVLIAKDELLAKVSKRNMEMFDWE